MTETFNIGGWLPNINDTDDDKLLKSKIPVDMFQGGTPTCPDCNYTDTMVVLGDYGFSTRIECLKCGSKFNYSTVFGPTRRGRPNPKGVEPVRHYEAFSPPKDGIGWGVEIAVLLSVMSVALIALGLLS